VLAGTLAIVFAAAIVQTVSGFGFVLVAAPLLSITIGPQPAVIVASALSLAMTFGRTITERAHVQWSVTARLLGWSILGMPFGVLVLKSLPPSFVAGMIAVMVLACTVLVWRGWRLHPSGWRARAIGVLCGVLTTSTGTNGPPLVAALQAMGVAPRVFRATMAALLTATGVVGLALLTAVGVGTTRDWLLCAAGLPVIVAGGWLGSRVLDRIDASRFRGIVLASLVAASTVALAHAVAPF
jgi:uncharacterized membrane protein YfcA